jgi:hypothetical protein
MRFLISVLVLCIALSATNSLAKTISFVGRAVNKSGGFEYLERHEVTYENGRVVRSRTVYTDRHNNVIGDLVSAFLPKPHLCSYTFRDLRAQYEDGVNVLDDRLVLYKKESPEKEKETTSLPIQSNQIVGQGFHHYLAMNRSSIARGEMHHVQLVLPSRLKQYGFRVRQRMVDGGTLHVRLEIDNWFIRLFAPHMDCQYDMETGHLLRYVGVSNLMSPSASRMNVDIIYTYEKKGH